MLLDMTTKTEKDDPQEGKTLCSLVSSLDELSIHETSKRDILDLEYRVSNVSFSDSDGIKHSQEDEDEEEEEEEKEDTEGADDLNAASSEPPSISVTDDDKKKKTESTEEEEEEVVESVSPPSVKSPSVKSDNESKTDDEDSEEKGLDLKVKEIPSHDEKTTGVDCDTQEEEKEKSSDVVQEEKLCDEKGAKGDEKKEENDSKKKAVVKKPERELLHRGLGKGTQSDQYQYFNPMSQVPHNNYHHQFVERPADAAIAYAPQMVQGMSPLQGMTPTYSNCGMPVSPLPGYTDSNLFSPMQNGDVGYFESGMSSVEGSFGWSGVMPYPDTPPSSVPDVNYQMSTECLFLDQDRSVSPCTNLTPTPSFDFSPDEVLEAIKSVMNDPDSSRVPNEKLVNIKNLLKEELSSHEFDANEMQAPLLFKSPNYQQAQSYNMNSYPTVPSPSCEDELAERNAEKEIQRFIDFSKFEKATKRMALITNEVLTSKDPDGDNPCVVVACQDESSDRFYENLVAMVERARTINICCEQPIPVVNTGETKTCVVCHNTNQDLFYSPFAMLNNNGDNLLSSVIRARQSQLVVTYICENIARRPLDVNRIFGGQNAELYRICQQAYPILGKLMCSY